MTNASIDEFAGTRLKSLERRGRRRELTAVTRGDDARIETPDDRLISFACNDYLGLARHPEVIAAALDATLRHGAGSGASRLISGNHSEYAALEAQLAAFKRTEDAVVFGSGYLSNIGIITALTGKRDLVLLDEYAHSCLRSGATLAGAAVQFFRHNETEHCAEILHSERRRHRHVIVATEGVFSMDGDCAPLTDLAQICTEQDAWLLCDDAHGLGVLGHGRGSVAQAGLSAQIPLQMGTLSKAIGAYGGFVCASHVVCEYLRNRARTFIYSTGLPPGVIAAAGKALEIIAQDGELTELPLQRAQTFTRLCDLPKAQSAIVPYLLGSSAAALELSEKLAADGFFVPAIRPPTVPQGTARLRFAFSAMHSQEDVEALAHALMKYRNEDDQQQ